MMPPILGNIIALLAVALLVYACARNLWGGHKSGGCSGNCASCSGGCSCGSSCSAEKMAAHISAARVKEMGDYFEKVRQVKEKRPF